MPRINIVESQIDVRPQAAPQVDPELFTSGAKTATESLQVLDQTVKEFKKVRDFNEVSAAELSLRQELGQIEMDANAEQDPNKIDDYRDKIDDAISRHSSKISDKLVQTEATSKFNLSGYSVYSNIANNFRQKSINIGQGNFLTSTNQDEISYANSDNPVDRKRIRDGWFTRLDEAHKAGLFAADDVAKMKITQTKKFDERDLMYDIQNIPGSVELRRKQGAYASLTDQEVSEGIQIARSFQEKLEKQQKEIVKKEQIKNEIEVISGAANGMIYGLDEVNAMVGNGEIRPEIGKAYVKYITSPKSIMPELDDTGYSKMVEGIFKAGNQDAIVSAIKDTLEGGADGKAKQEDIQNLIALANMRANELYSPTQDGIKPGSKQVEVDSLYKYVMDWAKNAKFDEAQKASLTSEWVNGLVSGNGADPKTVTDAVMKRAIIRQHPEVAALDDVPNMVISKDSPVRLIFPRSTNVYPRRIFNPKTGRLEANPEVDQKASPGK